MDEQRLRDVSFESKLVVGLVSGAEFVNHMYIVMLPPILGLLTEDFRVSLAVLGFALGTQRLSTAVFQLPFGYVSDRYGRVLGLALALTIGSAGVFVVAFSPSIPWLFLGVSIIGLGVAGHHPSHYPLLAGAVPEGIRGRVFSIRGFAGAIGFGTPAALITAVLSFPDTTWRHAIGLLGVVGLVYCAVAVIGLRRYAAETVREVDAQTEDQEPSQGTVGERARAAVETVLSSPPILAIALLSFVWAVATSGITSYAVVHMTNGYSVSLEVANLTFTGMFLAGAVMSLVGGALADRFSAGTVLMGGFLVLGVTVALFGSLLLPVVAVIPVALVIGGFRNFGGPARSKLIDGFSERSSLGRSFALMTVGMMTGGAVGPAVFGVMIEAAGLWMTFIAISLVAFVVTLIAGWVVVRYDEYEFSLRNLRSAT